MAGAAATVLRDQFARRRDASPARAKASAGVPLGLVTEADLAAENVILDLLRSHSPDDSVLAEESAAETTEPAEWHWVVDPLDGTNNFAHGLPWFAVSIACRHHGETVLGVIVDPVRDDWFLAARGQGAWHNGQRVHVASHDRLDQALIAVGFYYDRGNLMRATLRAIEDLFGQQIQGIRRCGACALDLAGVGLGQYGGYFEFTVAAWDCAAGALFVSEAGGLVTRCDGSPLLPGKTDILATNGRLHEAMLAIVGRHLAAASS
jgi:myo-inositol-1(or 4)-monophosphatase